MLNRLRKNRPHSTSEKTRFAFRVQQDDSSKGRLSLDSNADASPKRSIDDGRQRTTLLSEASARSMGTSLQQNTKPLPSIPKTDSDQPRRMASTIRSVPNHDDGARASSIDDDAYSTEWSPSARHSTSAFSNSLHSEYSAVSSVSQHMSPTGAGNGSRPSAKSSHSQAPAGHLATPIYNASRTQSRTPSPDSRRGADAGAVNGDRTPQLRRNGGPGINPGSGGSSRLNRQESPDGLGPGSNDVQLAANGWDSTVGKAALSGKTGRVINRLVSDNESLKRDIQIEKLKAEESRQAARLLEDKMERMAAEYESRLLDANITKTLLTKRERKVESLQAAVELEKQRTADARDKERTWREEMDKIRGDSKRTVEEASAHAALMEGRYNAISSHWREQGEQVEKTVARVRKEMAQLLEERARDDDKINMLRDLCDQQDGNIRDLRRQNEAINAKFAEYKATQEEALRDIKAKAAQREAEQMRQLEEAKEVLHKLKWALGVKENVRGAQ